MRYTPLIFEAVYSIL